MRACVILEGAAFRVTSYGRGTAYALDNLAERRSVFFQGDDAAQFRAELSSLEGFHASESPDQIAARLWHDYEYGLASSPMDEDGAPRLRCQDDEGNPCTVTVAADGTLRRG